MGEPLTREDLLEALSAQTATLRQEMSAQTATLRQEMVTQQDIAALRQEMAEQNAALSADLIERTTELVRDAQTEILRAFFPFQEAMGVRFRKVESDNNNLHAGLTLRMDILERRLYEIEKKLLMEPPAA